MNRLLLKWTKYLSSFREGYAAISLFIPFLNLTEFYQQLKSFWSCSHMNCCLQILLHQFTYVIYNSYQGKLNHSKIMKIQQVLEMFLSLQI